MTTCKVKWFNNAKGYGLILPENDSGDLLAHYTSIEMEGYKTLKAGQAVNFDIIKGDKASHAVNITFDVIQQTLPSIIPSDTSTDTLCETLDQKQKSHLESV
jgi:CspA family cold shock protein